MRRKITRIRGALLAIGIGDNDEVITTPYTFIATYSVVLGSCALPVFADTDPETFQINPDKIEERITEKTRAIIVQHTFGIPAEMDPIMALAKEHNLAVIEDWILQAGQRTGCPEIPPLQASLTF